LPRFEDSPRSYRIGAQHQAIYSIKETRMMKWVKWHVRNKNSISRYGTVRTYLNTKTEGVRNVQVSQLYVLD